MSARQSGSSGLDMSGLAMWSTTSLSEGNLPAVQHVGYNLQPTQFLRYINNFLNKALSKLLYYLTDICHVVKGGWADQTVEWDSFLLI